MGDLQGVFLLFVEQFDRFGRIDAAGIIGVREPRNYPTDSYEEQPDMPGYKGILFDMDGVLVDSEPLFYKAVNMMVERCGAAPITEKRTIGICWAPPLRRRGYASKNCGTSLNPRRSSWPVTTRW